MPGDSFFIGVNDVEVSDIDIRQGLPGFREVAGDPQPGESPGPGFPVCLRPAEGNPQAGIDGRRGERGIEARGYAGEGVV